MDRTEIPTIRSMFHSLLDKKLCVDHAAAVLLEWTDGIRRKAQAPDAETAPEQPRDFYTLSASNQELYRLLVYRVACSLVDYEGEHAKLVETELADAVELSSERIPL